MLSAIRHRREAAPSWGQASISRALGPLLDAVGHGVALLDKRKEPDERCILDVKLACQNSDFDCEASPVGVQVRLLQRVARRSPPSGVSVSVPAAASMVSNCRPNCTEGSKKPFTAANGTTMRMLRLG